MNKKGFFLSVMIVVATFTAIFLIFRIHNNGSVDNISEADSTGEKKTAILFSKKSHHGIAGNKEAVLDEFPKEFDRDSMRNVRHHPLDSPSSFVRNGVYIWCDSDGVWSVFWKGGEEVLLEIEMVFDEKFEIVKKTNGFRTLSMDQAGKIKIINEKDYNKGVLQFKVGGSQIQFNVLFDNQTKLENVYIGTLLKNPKNHGFTLPIRNNMAMQHGGIPDEQTGRLNAMGRSIYMNIDDSSDGAIP